MKLQAVQSNTQNNRQNVHFKQLSGNTNFLKHNFSKAIDGVDALGQDLLIKLNADPALKGVKGEIEHSGTSNFFHLKGPGWFGKKNEITFDNSMADENVTLNSLKENILKIQATLVKKK